MKKLILISSILVIIPTLLNAQITDVNIWDVTKDFLFENGELNDSSNSRPIIDVDGTRFSYFIFFNNEVISDPDYVIENSRQLIEYRFGILAPHKPMHLLYTKNGEYRCVNMQKNITCIMQQCAVICNELSLSSEESLKIFETVILQYKNNIKYID